MSHKLFMVLLGCRPKGRNTEQHDIFFGVAEQLRDLVPAIKEFWKNASPIHVDAWREVSSVDGFSVQVSAKGTESTGPERLFFLNLGGYKEGHFDEFHYKMLTVAEHKDCAAANAKASAFFLHTGFDSDAAAHIDDRFGIDVDDLFEINDILPAETKEQFCIRLSPLPAGHAPSEDEMHLGYFPLHKL